MGHDKDNGIHISLGQETVNGLNTVLNILLWRIGGHCGINGDHGTFWIHNHDGSVSAVEG